MMQGVAREKPMIQRIFAFLAVQIKRTAFDVLCIDRACHNQLFLGTRQGYIEYTKLLVHRTAAQIEKCRHTHRRIHADKSALSRKLHRDTKLAVINRLFPRLGKIQPSGCRRDKTNRKLQALRFMDGHDIHNLTRRRKLRNVHLFFIFKHIVNKSDKAGKPTETAAFKAPRIII